MFAIQRHCSPLTPDQSSASRTPANSQARTGPLKSVERGSTSPAARTKITAPRKILRRGITTRLTGGRRTGQNCQQNRTAAVQCSRLVKRCPDCAHPNEQSRTRRAYTTPANTSALPSNRDIAAPAGPLNRGQIQPARPSHAAITTATVSMIPMRQVSAPGATVTADSPTSAKRLAAEQRSEVANRGFMVRRLTLRLRHAGSVVFDCKLERRSGVASGRMVKRSMPHITDCSRCRGA